MRPLKRKPKHLDSEPTAFQPGRGGKSGLLLASSGRQRRGPGAGGGTTDPGASEEAGSAVALQDLADKAVDETVRQQARQIARRLAVARPVATDSARRGVGELASVRWRGSSTDIDLDATLDVLAGNPRPSDEDIVVREWVRARRSVVLVVDVSGSMKGERIRTAAATVAALGSALVRDQLAVIAFWSDAAVLVPRGEPADPLAVLDLLLRVPTQGLTNVGFGLELARRQLVDVPARDARVVLLSDCVHNAGPDPRIVAGRLPRLDVLLDTSGENDVDLGRDLAAAGQGQCRLIRTFRDVAPALTSVFDL